jgi:hypothetical protein
MKKKKKGSNFSSLKRLIFEVFAEEYRPFFLGEKCQFSKEKVLTVYRKE